MVSQRVLLVTVLGKLCLVLIAGAIIFLTPAGVSWAASDDVGGWSNTWGDGESNGLGLGHCKDKGEGHDIGLGNGHDKFDCPELDPCTGAGALALLVGGLLILRSKKVGPALPQ